MGGSGETACFRVGSQEIVDLFVVEQGRESEVVGSEVGAVGEKEEV